MLCLDLSQPCSFDSSLQTSSTCQPPAASVLRTDSSCVLQTRNMGQSPLTSIKTCIILNNTLVIFSCGSSSHLINSALEALFIFYHLHNSCLLIILMPKMCFVFQTMKWKTLGEEHWNQSLMAAGVLPTVSQQQILFFSVKECLSI